MFSPCKPRVLPQLVRGPSALTSPVGWRQLELVSLGFWEHSGHFDLDGETVWEPDTEGSGP